MIVERHFPGSVLIRRHEVKPSAETDKPTFGSVGFIGVGQTGELFLKTITERIPQVRTIGIEKELGQATDTLQQRYQSTRFSGIDRIRDILQSDERPEVLIVTTPNPTGQILAKIATWAGDKPLTVILTQNGIDVVPKAQEMMGKNITIIRGSLFTPVSRHEDGSIKYNPEKLRMGLSEASNSSLNKPDEEQLAKAQELFRRAGFDTRVYESYRALELAKLELNAVGTTGEITGFSPKQTFKNRRLREIELAGISQRREIIARVLKRENIEPAEIPWGGANQMPLLDKPMLKKVRNLPPFSMIIGRLVTKGRENKPPSTAMRIQAGAETIEQTEAIPYHQPFIEMGRQVGVRAEVDEAVLGTLQKYPSKIDLREMREKDKKRLMLDSVGQRGVISKVEKGFEKVATKILESKTFGLLTKEFFLRTIRVKVVNEENLDLAKKILDEGGSLIVIYSHVDTLDEAVYAKVLGKHLKLKGFIVFIADKYINPVRNWLKAALMRGHAKAADVTFADIAQTDDHFHSKDAATEINLNSVLGTARALRKGRKMAALTPGGHRSKHQLLEAEDGVATLFKGVGDNTWAISAAARHGRIIPFLTRTTVTIGVPYRCSDLVKRCKDQGLSREKVDEAIKTAAMLDLAYYLPKKERGPYQDAKPA